MSRISRPLPSLEAFGLSDVGLQRTTNEDAYAVVPHLGFYAVADGVGGAAAGDVASRMAIDVVVGVIEAAATSSDGLSASVLLRAVQDANTAVCAAAALDPTRAGMGTTFTGLLVLKDRVFIVHVGDSRAYLLRGGRLHRLTEDHTLVNAYVQNGVMTTEQAATSPMRNIILRAIGPDETVNPDARALTIQRGDTLLLASDGLHGVVEDADIAATLVHERELTRATTRLVERANDAGGPDNITVVILRIG
jgi:protein phosphatase